MTIRASRATINGFLEVIKVHLAHLSLKYAGAQLKVSHLCCHEAHTSQLQHQSYRSSESYEREIRSRWVLQRAILQQQELLVI